MITMSKDRTKNKNKERTDKEFEDEMKKAIETSTPKTDFCGLLGTKEGMEILRKMTWVDIEELTDYEFFG